MFAFENKVAAVQLTTDHYSTIKNELRRFQARWLEDLLQLGLTAAQVQHLCLGIKIEKNEEGYQVSFPVFSVADRNLQALMIFNCSVACELPSATVSMFEVLPPEENLRQLMVLLLSISD